MRRRLRSETQFIGDPNLDDLLAGVAVARVQVSPGLRVALGIDARLEDVLVAEVVLLDQFVADLEVERERPELKHLACRQCDLRERRRLYVDAVLRHHLRAQPRLRVLYLGERDVCQRR